MERKPDYKGASHFVEQYRTISSGITFFTHTPLPVTFLTSQLKHSFETGNLKTVAVFLIKPKP